MIFNEFTQDMILAELEDAVGRENCSQKPVDKITHSVDYFWLPRMWSDRGLNMPQADVVVSPKNAKETSAVMKIANYYKLPVTTWGGGGGTQGGALPVCGGIELRLQTGTELFFNGVIVCHGQLNVSPRQKPFLHIVDDDFVGVNLYGFQIGMIDLDGQRFLGLIIDDVGGRQTVQIHDEVSGSRIRDVLGLFQKIKVQLSDQTVGQLCGHSSFLGGDDELAHFVMVGEEYIGKVDLHFAVCEINGVEVDGLDPVCHLQRRDPFSRVSEKEQGSDEGGKEQQNAEIPEDLHHGGFMFHRFNLLQR
jgi:hypothetical protein